MSLNDFEYGRILGKGVFGSVCIVKRKEDNEIYAMKRVKIGGLTKKELENSFNEVRLLASLNHKNVIGYREAFYDQKSKTLNIVMEYADDGDLSTKIKNAIKKKQYFSENIIWSTLIQILQGLNYLHKSNIIHRDLKSANIFLTKKGIVKIGDLNVSKIIGKNMAITQTGTPYYASPEIWNDQPYNYKCDIWSTGIIIYEMAALKLPFRGTSMNVLYQNVMKGEFQPLSCKYSKDLQNIIKMILIINPKNRKTAEELLNCDIIKNKILEIGFGDENCNKEERALLMKTIKIPKNINLVNGQLPKKNYKKDRKINMMQMFENDEYETAKNSFYHPNNGEKKLFNYMIYNNDNNNIINNYNIGKNINNYNRNIYNNNININNSNNNVNNNIHNMNIIKSNNMNNNINKNFVTPLKYKPLMQKEYIDKLSNLMNNNVILSANNNNNANNLMVIPKNNNERYLQNLQNSNKISQKVSTNISTNATINTINNNNQNFNNNRYMLNNKKISITDNSNSNISNILDNNNISNNNYPKIKNNNYRSRQKSVSSKDSLHISTSNIYNNNQNKNILFNNITSFSKNISNNMKNKLNIPNDLSEIHRYEMHQMNRNINTNITNNNIQDISNISQRPRSKNLPPKYQQKGTINKNNNYFLNNLNNYENINNNNKRVVKRSNLKKGRYNINNNNISNINTDNISNNRVRASSQMRGKQNLNVMDEYQMEYNKLIKQINYLSSLVEDKQKENKYIQRNKTDLIPEKLDEKINKNLLHLGNLNKIFRQNNKNINVKININNNYNNINNLNISNQNNINKNNNINNLVRNKSAVHSNMNNDRYNYEYGNSISNNNNKRINRPKSCLRIDDNREKLNNRLLNDNNEKYSDLYKYYYQKYKENKNINVENNNGRKIIYEKINIINNKKGENRQYEKCGEKIRYVGNGNFYNDYNRDIIKNSNLLKFNNEYSIHNFLNKDNKSHKDGPRIILPNKIMNLQ